MSRLDTRLATIGKGRRAELAGEASTLDTQALPAWLAREGRDAAWVLLDDLRTGGAHDLAATLPCVVAELGELPDTAHCCVEVLRAIPGDQQRRVRAALAQLAPLPAFREALRDGLTGPHRRLFAQHLLDTGDVAPTLLATWLADPALRPLAVDAFARDVAAHERLLRTRLDAATPGERDAIVRLLRRLDPSLTRDGARDATTDGALQAQLRASPHDEEVAQVWADLLIDRHDVRGEHIALELAIRHAEPVRALELSRTQAALARDRTGLWHEPGGFPFREKFRGKSAIVYASDKQQLPRAGSCEALVDRVQTFIDVVTDVRAPRYVFFGRRYDPLARVAPFDEPSPLALDLCTALGADALGIADKHGGFVRRECVDAPIADLAAFRAACARDPMLTLAYEFQLAWPHTRVPLPHQEGEHYADDQPLGSSLRIFLSDRSLQLRLAFPFEDRHDPRFGDVLAAIRETLGPVLATTGWRSLAPSADGSKLVAKRITGP